MGVCVISLISNTFRKVKRKIEKIRENRVYNKIYDKKSKFMHKQRCLRCQVIVYDDDYCDNCGNPMSYIN